MNFRALAFAQIRDARDTFSDFKTNEFYFISGHQKIVLIMTKYGKMAIYCVA